MTHPCGSCSKRIPGRFTCIRCGSREAFGWHPHGAHRDAEIRCAACHPLPPALRGAGATLQEAAA